MTPPTSFALLLCGVACVGAPTDPTCPTDPAVDVESDPTHSDPGDSDPPSFLAQSLPEQVVQCASELKLGRYRITGVDPGTLPVPESGEVLVHLDGLTVEFWQDGKLHRIRYARAPRPIDWETPPW